MLLRFSVKTSKLQTAHFTRTLGSCMCERTQAMVRSNTKSPQVKFFVGVEFHGMTENCSCAVIMAKAMVSRGTL